jgi:hypothetical protein
MVFAVGEVHVNGADRVGADRGPWAAHGEGEVHICVGAYDSAGWAMSAGGGRSGMRYAVDVFLEVWWDVSG